MIRLDLNRDDVHGGPSYPISLSDIEKIEKEILRFACCAADLADVLQRVSDEGMTEEIEHILRYDTPVKIESLADAMRDISWIGLSLMHLRSRITVRNAAE